MSNSSKQSKPPLVMAQAAPAAAPVAAEPGAHVARMLLQLFSTDRHEETEKLARWVTEQFPGSALGWKVLGAVLKNARRNAEALLPMQKAVELNMRDHEAINNLGVTLRELGHTEHAVACFRSAIEVNPNYPDAYDHLGSIYQDQQKFDLALACYREKLRLNPDDIEVQHLVDSMSGVTTARAPEGYVEKVFDAFADEFDHRLQGVLGYDAPSRLAALVREHLEHPQGSWRVLDLGCGTGLVGAAVAPQASHLVGVDLSGNMIEKSKARGVYHRLEKAELVGMLQQEPADSYDAIFAADVFIYVGKLDDVVPEVRRLLSKGGLFAFSVERLGEGEDPLGFKLNPTGRYSHSQSYLAALAAQHSMAVVTSVEVPLRMEHGRPIVGDLIVWRVASTL